MPALRCCCLLLLLGVTTPVLARICPSGLPRVAPDARYSITEPVVGQFVVTDLQTGLMWKQCSEGQTGTTCTGEDIAHSWPMAIALANDSQHAGFNDWRLPNREELRGLVETGCFVPAINTNAFPSTVLDNYWSSTTYAPFTSNAWAVSFHGGSTSSSDKGVRLPVRLVRGGQGFDTFSAEADGVPDGFSLAPQSGVPTSSLRTSAPITVTGLTTVTGIGVTGAAGSTYSINGGDYTSQPGTVANGNEVRVRHTSAAASGTATTTSLNIGGVTADFVSTTAVTSGVDISLVVRRGGPAAKHLPDALAKGATLASYLIEARNNGAQAATGLRIVVSPIVGVNDVLWTCGAPCTPPNGSNSIDTATNLPSGGFVPITLTGSVDSTKAFIEITAQASLPAGTPGLPGGVVRRVFIEPAGVSGVYKSGFE